MGAQYDYKKQDVLAQLVQFISQYDAEAKNFEALLEYIHEICREDAFRHEKILIATENREKVHEALHTVVRKVAKAAVADKVAYLATGLIAHDSKYRTPGDVEGLAITLIDRRTLCSNAGVLAAMANLLKVPKFRAHLWNISCVHVLIRNSLSPSKADTLSQYQATLCSWLLTFSPKFISHLVESGIFLKLLQLLKSTPRKEKIVRLGIEIVANSVNCLDAVQAMLDEKLGDTLDILVFEKWRSEELYSRIEEVNSIYTKKIREWSTFERYNKELATGRLLPGYIHEDQFWADNVMEFEENEFLSIRKLINLLKSSDPVTLALACHDLGEFSRLHPIGKKILHKLSARDMLLALLNHQDRNVERESLLAIQKLMLDDWEAVGTN